MKKLKKEETSTPLLYEGSGIAPTMVVPKHSTTYAGNGVDTSGSEPTVQAPDVSYSGNVETGNGVGSTGSGNVTGGGDIVVTGDEVVQSSGANVPNPSDWDVKKSYVYDAVSGTWVPKAETKVDTYEQFLAGAEERAKGVRDDTYAANAATRVSAEKNAEKERQRAIVDANVSYQLNTSAYGANAERLAGMGLTNSGYADYMKSQSYAQMRGEVQYANAQSDYAKRVASEQEAAGNREADLKYSDYVNTAEGKLAEYQQGKVDQLTAAADTLLAAAANVRSTEELEALISRANNAGLSQEVINNIKAVGDSAVVKYGDEAKELAYGSIINALAQGASISLINTMMNDADIEEGSDYYNSIMTEIQLRWADLEEQARNGEISAESIYDQAKSCGYIDANGEWINTPEAIAAKDAYDAATEKKEKDTAYDWANEAYRARNGELSPSDILAKAKAEGAYANEKWVNADAKAAYDAAMESYEETQKQNEADKNAALIGFGDEIQDPEYSGDVVRTGSLYGLTEEESKAEYSKILAKDVTKNMFKDMSEEDAKSLYHEIFDDPYVDSVTKNKLREYYNNRYIVDGVAIVDATVNNRGLTAGKNKNFKITVGNEEYKVEHGTKVGEYASKELTETYKKQSGKDVSKGDIVVYQGRIFIYCETSPGSNGWVSVQRRKSASYSDEFEDLCDALGITYYSNRGEEF